ncbi:unnamed protein product [Linum tenue]|uniref:Cw7 protein n=1 Tax=Linum tenue TaxID=586396 RepID=A0AAV0I791_9ROSI|nr:unnamed protein product [Linum tenue]
MLGVGGDTPSRYELLTMVKKHSAFLGREENQDPSDAQMDIRFWRDVFDMYFVRGKGTSGREEDDLIFFVKKKMAQERGAGDDEDDDSPYFVRRWAPKLDHLITESSVDVDWGRSFYLNMIAHTSYTVTVAICSHHVLQNHQAGQNMPLSPVYKVVKTVYASPSRVNFHLDSKKEVETTPAYPEICFAVDDFDSTFDAVVLTERDHCYCVLLNAHDGAAFPNEKESHDSGSSNTSGSAKMKASKLTLFSGFVSYQMVRQAYEAGKPGFGSLLSLGQSPRKPDRLFMKGPGGRGEVEVAVSGVAGILKIPSNNNSLTNPLLHNFRVFFAILKLGFFKDQSQVGDIGPFSPLASKKGFGIGSIMKRAASVASEAAKNAYAAASSSAGSDDEMLPLKCCLMSISLPWEDIACDLLFKGSPPVNM